MEDNPCDSSPGLSTESSSCSWVCYEQDNHTSNNAYCPDWNPRKCDGVITVKSRRRKLIDKLEFFLYSKCGIKCRKQQILQEE